MGTIFSAAPAKRIGYNNEKQNTQRSACCEYNGMRAGLTHFRLLTDDAIKRPRNGKCQKFIVAGKHVKNANEQSRYQHNNRPRYRRQKR